MIKTNGDAEVAIIRALDETNWISCKNITKNLELSYKKIFKTQSYTLYSESSYSQVIHEIIQSDIHTLVFLDHRVRLLEILLYDELINFLKHKNIKVIIHTYGCFYDRLEEYFNAGKILKGLEVVFIGASPRQTNLIKKVIETESVAYCPFPVNTSFFSFEENERLKTREELNIPLHTPLLIYAGRISYAKNVEVVMKYLLSLRESNKIKFLYVGDFDAFDPLWGQSYHGQMIQLNTKIKNTIDPKNEWCHHIPHRSFFELRKIYAAADAYISFSTYKNDDFALSVAEAKCMGLPSFTTDWGGHSTYQSIPSSYFAPVKVTDKDIMIETETIEQKLKTLTPLSLSERTSISLEAHKKLSIDAVADNLKKIIESKWPKFNGVSSKEVFIRKLMREGGFQFINQARHIYETYWN